MKKRNLVKGIAVMMAFIVSVTGVHIQPAKAKTDNNVNEDNKQQYIIQFESPDIYESITKNYDMDVLDNSMTNSLDKENIIIAEITDSEAEKLADETGIVALEEDIFVTGSTNNDTKDILINTDGEKIYNIPDEDSTVDNISSYDNDIVTINENDRKNIEWSLDVINANNNEYTIGNDTVKIAILDSGITATADINVEKRINLIPGEENVEVLYDDISGHGTAIASVIAGKDDENGVTGVNPNAKIYSVKVLDEDNRANVSRIAEGIYKCIDEGVDIINMSFGTTGDSEILHNAIQAADNAGILMIAAAGNRGEQDKKVEYPAAYPEVFSVGATNTKSELSNISSSGNELNIVAPGENVAVLGIWDEINLMDGTSLSTAEVTGAASVLLSLDNTKSPEFIRELISSAANYNAGTYNAGIIDLAYAISVYDEFAEKFQTHKTDDIINTQNIAVYSADEVKASWQTTLHENVLNGFSGISAAALKIIKKGLRYPDDYRFGDSFPALNGNRNYIADYIYIAKLARTTYTDGLSNALNDVGHPINGDNGTYSVADVKRYLSNISWSDILGYAPKSVSAERLRNDQGRFLIGMAMHTAMDAYAHRARIDGLAYNGTQADQQTLGSGYSDKITKDFNLRWTVAKKVAEGAATQWTGEHDFSILQFHKAVHEEKLFKMQHFLSYAKNSDSGWSGRSSSVKTFFELRKADE